MSDVDLEQELAAVKAERASKQEAREAAQRQAQLAKRLEREKRGIVEDETFAKLVEEHGEDAIRRINTPLGMVVVKAPQAIVYRRYLDATMRSDHANPKVRTSFVDETEKMVRHCLVYPDRARFDELAEKVATLGVVAANAAADLGKAREEEDSGK